MGVYGRHVEGVGRGKAIPDIPITVMASNQATLRVVPKDAPTGRQPFLDRSVRERWNDYGIGLLLQGDIKGAEAAFLKVTADGAGLRRRLGQRRARAHSGRQHGRRRTMLRQGARRSTPTWPRRTSSSGTSSRALGRYDEALDHLRKAATHYPRDRVVLEPARARAVPEAAVRGGDRQLQQVLAIDPEDLQAHYNLMLAYQGLGDAAEAERERRLYERFKADESAQAITGHYRRLNPDDNNERQSIHEHRRAETDERSPARTSSVRMRVPWRWF